MSGSTLFPPVFIPPQTGPYAGMSQAQLQALLAQAQAALPTLVSGGRPVTISYSSGEGNRTVTYARSSEAALRNMIRELQVALGLFCARRRAMPVMF
jgi:hypothetical protein